MGPITLRRSGRRPAGGRTTRSGGASARALLILAAAALALWPAEARANRFGPPWLGAVATERVITRVAPNPRAAPIGPLGRGALVPVLGELRGADGARWLSSSVGFLPGDALVEHDAPFVAAVRLARVAVRASPFAASPARLHAENGALLRVVGLSPDLGGTGAVWWATNEGYVGLDALHAAPAGVAWELPDAAAAPGGWWGETTADANVRVGAGTDTTKVGLLPAGTRVKVLEEVQGRPVGGDPAWYRIDGGRYAGAWLHGSLVRRIAAPSANTAAPPTPPPDSTWIVVDRSVSTLTLVRSGRATFTTYVSAGDALDETPTGRYATFGKYRTDDMTSTSVTDADHAYDLPNVPHTQYFRDGGYAIHGAYWHDAFGGPRSEGCVNLTLTDAAYVFGLTRPALDAETDARWARPGAATPVLVVE